MKQRTENHKFALMQDSTVLLLFAIISIIVLKGNAWVPGLDGDSTAYHVLPYQLMYDALYENGELPLWNPYLWGGITGIHNITFPFSPVIYLLLMIFHSTGAFVGYVLVENILIFHLWLLQAGLYCLLRQAKVSRLSAFVSTCVCGVCAGTLCFPGWFNFTISLSYAPMILALLVYINDTSKPVFSWRNVLLGLAFSQLMLLELAQGAVLVAILWAGLYLFYVIGFFPDKREIVRITLKSLFSGLIGVGIASVSIIPTIYLGQENVRLVPDVGVLGSNDAIPFWSFINHAYEGGQIRALLGDNGGYLSLSLAACILMVLGAFAKTNHQTEKILASFAKLVVLFAVVGGYGAWFSDYLYYVPFVNQIREPFLYSGVLFVGVAILGAIGFEKAIISCKNASLSECFYTPKLLLFLVLSISVLAIMPHRLDLVAAAGIVLTAAILGVQKLWHWRYQPVLCMALSLMLVICNAMHVREDIQALYTAEEATRKVQTTSNYNRAEIAKIEEPTSNNMFRIMEWGTTRVFPLNSSVYCKTYSISDYWNPINEKTMFRHLNVLLEKRIPLENVKYWFVADDSTIDLSYYQFEAIQQSVSIYSGYEAMEPTQVKVFKNQNYLGAAWLVYDFLICPEGSGEDDIVSYLNNVSVDVAKTAVVDYETGQKLSHISASGARGTVTETEYGNNSIRMVCETNKAGLLMITEPVATGWKAYVDGKETEILTVNYDRKGILLEEGAHEITLIYRPDIFVLGSTISAVVIAGCGIYVCIYLAARKMKKGDPK